MGACKNVDLPTGRKAEMVERLSKLLDKPSQERQAEPKPTTGPATKDDVIAVL